MSGLFKLTDPIERPLSLHWSGSPDGQLNIPQKVPSILWCVFRLRKSSSSKTETVQRCHSTRGHTCVISPLTLMFRCHMTNILFLMAAPPPETRISGGNTFIIDSNCKVIFISKSKKTRRFWGAPSPLYYQNNKINVACVYIVKTQLYLLVVHWLSTTLGTTTCFSH